MIATRTKNPNKSQVFVLTGGDALANTLAFIAKLPLDSSLEVEIRSHKETRNDKQNRLMWHWNRQVSEQKHIDAKFVHGQTKLEVLLPLMFAWGVDKPSTMARAEFLDSIMTRIPEYRIKVGVAFDMVRTRELNIEEFTNYLNHVAQFWAEQGVLLTTSDDLYYEAMGRTKPH